MSDNKKRFQLKNFAWWFVFFSLLVSMIFIIIRIYAAPSDIIDTAEYENMKSDYMLSLLQCFLGLFALMLPTVLNRKWQIVLPNNMMLLYVLFLYCAIYLGEVRSFFYRIPYWDTVLHTFSGVMLGAFGFSVVSLLNEAKKAKVNLSPLFVAMFAFFFAVSLGVIWEIYEFTVDSFFGLNMQKSLLQSGEPKIGKAALTDTMKDLIVDTIGAFAISVIGYFSIRRKSDWLDNFDIRKDLGQ